MSGKKPKKKSIRMDFIQESVHICELPDGSPGFEAKLRLDPEKYDEIEVDGEKAYRDKYTGMVIPLKVIAESAEGLKGVPIYCSPPKQNDASIYLREAKAELMANWDKKYQLQKTKPAFNEFLKENTGKETTMVILYVDMEGSTRISSTVDPGINAKIIKIFLMQMAKAIDNHRGFVLKFVGDCAIGIFPAETNSTGMCDNSIQSAMTIRGLVEQVINPVFKEKGLPEVGFHIGVDVGEVFIDNVGAINIAGFVDLIGYHMNRTAKIQAMAGHNDILLGENLFTMLHGNWQKYCAEIEVGNKGKFVDQDTGEPYGVYRFMGKWDCEI